MISLIKQGNIEDMNKFLSYSSNELIIKKRRIEKKTKDLPSLYNYLKENYYENTLLNDTHFVVMTYLLL